jgi:phosphatidylserine decarboxylase
MAIPLTKYGWPQVVVCPIAVLAAMTLVAVTGLSGTPKWVVISCELVLAVILLWVLAFFRDPARQPPKDDALLVAPADGTITDIETMEHSASDAGPVLRIGIFLSIFNVHINRAPCRAKIENIMYRKGRYINALNPLSSKINESNDLTLRRVSEPTDCLLIRQISGAIARRIVCAARPEQELAQGQAFGMIKFGSRTELHVPVNGNAECVVRVGDKVKAGETVLVRYTTKCQR